MATFSVNQNRQLFVAKNVVTTTPAAVGDLKLGGDKASTYMYFQHMGYGGLTRSDKIDLSNVMYAKTTKAEALSRKLKKATVTLDSEVNGGNPISGQDYVLRIFFRQYIGNSDIYQEAKYGVVHGYKGMTASDFYKTLALSLAMNFSKEVVPLLKFYLKTSSGSTEVTASTAKKDLTDTYTGVVIEEAEQPWRLGVRRQEEVFFDVIPTTVLFNSEEVIWGTVENGTSETTIKNGKKMADLEYFCMGERGDVYRGIGFPNNIPTTYLVDSTVKYNVIDIHYAYVGSNESVQKSEKTITLVVPKVGANNQASNKLANDIITAINTATGLNITKLDVSA